MSGERNAGTCSSFYATWRYLNCARTRDLTDGNRRRYNYVLLDDGWPACDEWSDPSQPGASACKNPAPRLENGDVVVDPKKFPPSKPGLNDGIKVVADHLHSKGLKMGIYTAPHGQTCGGYWGMLGHEATDAAMYAGWGIVSTSPSGSPHSPPSTHYRCLVAVAMFVSKARLPFLASTVKRRTF